MKIFFFLCFFFSGCAHFLAELRGDDQDELEDTVIPIKYDHAQASPIIEKNLVSRVRVTKEDFIDQSQDEGSLWASNGQTNYFFTKNKIRSPGDLISIMIDEELQNNILIEVKKNLSAKDLLLLLGDTSVSESSKKNTKKDLAANEEGAKEKNPQEGSQFNSPSNNKTDKMNLAMKVSNLDLSDFFKIKSGDSMLGEVLSRYPNGNYKIKGIKKINYKQNISLTLSITGVIKATDINEDTDKVNPGTIYEYEIQVLRSEKT